MALWVWAAETGREAVECRSSARPGLTEGFTRLRCSVTMLPDRPVEPRCARVLAARLALGTAAGRLVSRQWLKVVKIILTTSGVVR